MQLSAEACSNKILQG